MTEMVPRSEVNELMTEIHERILLNRSENRQHDRLVSTELRTTSIFTGAHAMPDGGWHSMHEAGDGRAYVRIRIPVRVIDWLSDIRMWIAKVTS